jgi:hypothetical protein
MKSRYYNEHARNFHHSELLVFAKCYLKSHNNLGILFLKYRFKY